MSRGGRSENAQNLFKNKCFMLFWLPKSFIGTFYFWMGLGTVPYFYQGSCHFCGSLLLKVFILLLWKLQMAFCSTLVQVPLIAKSNFSLYWFLYHHSKIHIHFVSVYSYFFIFLYLFWIIYIFLYFFIFYFIHFMNIPCWFCVNYFDHV